MRRILTTALGAALVIGCGSGGDTTAPQGLVLSRASASGDGQTGSPGSTLTPFKVILANDGTPVSGTIVQWTIATGGGSLDTPTSLTDDSGVATATLTLGQNAGQTSVQATVSGANGSPVTLVGTAVIPGLFEQVNLVNNEFEPASVTLQPGGTVLFNWSSGSRDHDVVPVSPGTKPSAAVHDGPFTLEVSFNTAGAYRFYCSVHGAPSSGMHGEVVVQ